MAQNPILDKSFRFQNKQKKPEKLGEFRCVRVSRLKHRLKSRKVLLRFKEIDLDSVLKTILFLIHKNIFLNKNNFIIDLRKLSRGLISKDFFS